MPKRTTALELMLPSREPGAPAYRWLYASLRAEILAGRLRPGARLPGTRDLAGQYGLSRGTIVSAFEQLASEGYVEGSVGSGTYVTKNLPDDLLQVARQADAGSVAREKPQRSVSDYGRRVTPFPVLEHRPTRAFRTDLPALDLFPTTLWAQIAARRLKRVSVGLLLGCDPLGYRPLRDAVADYLGTSRGVQCMPEQVAIVSGVQEALDLVARLVLNPGDRVCVEDPGYTGAAIVFEAAGARVAPVSVDMEGLELSPASLSGARLVYVTPAHQFPLGITMSLRRRLELLDWARTSGTLIFEDDYDSEYRYSGRPVPALQGLDGSGLVLFAGSFNKVLFPSLRLGYLVIPPDLVDTFAATRSVTSRHPPLLEQTVLLEISTVEAGLQTAGRLCDGIDSEWAAKAAAARDVEVVPLRRFSRGAMAHEGLQLGFAAVDAGEIRRGVRELEVVLEGASRRTARTAGLTGAATTCPDTAAPGAPPVAARG